MIVHLALNADLEKWARRIPPAARALDRKVRAGSADVDPAEGRPRSRCRHRGSEQRRTSVSLAPGRTAPVAGFRRRRRGAVGESLRPRQRDDGTACRRRAPTRTTAELPLAARWVSSRSGSSRRSSTCRAGRTSRGDLTHRASPGRRTNSSRADEARRSGPPATFRPDARAVVLRPGSIAVADLARVLGDMPRVRGHGGGAAQVAGDRPPPRVSGDLPSHYAPQTPTRRVDPAHLQHEARAHAGRTAVLARMVGPPAGSRRGSGGRRRPIRRAMRGPTPSSASSMPPESTGSSSSRSRIRQTGRRSTTGSGRDARHRSEAPGRFRTKRMSDG